MISPSGGTYTLTADLNFGATFGVVSAYFKSRASNIATAGVLRLANTDVIDWRNAANNANLALGVDTSNQLTFNGNPIVPSTALTASKAVVTNASGVLTTSATTATQVGYLSGASGTTGTANLVYSLSPTLSGIPIVMASAPLAGVYIQFNTSAAAARGYVGFGGSSSSTFTVENTEAGPIEFNANSALRASISSAGVYRITNLSTGIVHADSSGNLTSSLLVNADVSGSAAIAYSKLALTGAIVNADITNSTINLTTKVTGTLPLANGGTNATTIAGLTAQFTAPTVQRFTSGSGTCTLSANVKYIRVIMAGGGGGGGGSGTGSSGTDGTTGGSTTFGSSLHTAAGGVLGKASQTGASGGAGGAATLGTGGAGTALAGGRGGAYTTSAGATIGIGGANGGSNALSGVAISSFALAGVAGIANTGGGGASGGGGGNATATNSGEGGGAGAYMNFIIAAPAATYAYGVGAGGNAGGAGTSGFAGGAGGAGYIEVQEFYQ